MREFSTPRDFRPERPLYPGEVLALAGDNGAGKSTLIKIISGVHHADGGSLWYEGKEIKLENPHQARAYGIETIYQDLALADNLDVGADEGFMLIPSDQHAYATLGRPRHADTPTRPYLALLRRLFLVRL